MVKILQAEVQLNEEAPPHSWFEMSGNIGDIECQPAIKSQVQIVILDALYIMNSVYVKNSIEGSDEVIALASPSNQFLQCSCIDFSFCILVCMKIWSFFCLIKMNAIMILYGRSDNSDSSIMAILLLSERNY